MDEVVRPSTAVVVGGSGAIGTMFAGMMVDSGLHVVSVDMFDPEQAGRLDSVLYVKGDITAPDDSVRGVIADADMVMLALPEEVIRSSISQVSNAMRSGSLLVEPSSVKSRVTTDMGAVADKVEAVGLNPMFFPSAGANGRPVAVVTSRDGPIGRGLVELMTEWGMVPAQVDAEYHDRITAATQVATHAAILTLGMTLIDLEVDIDDLARLATPPHMALLSMLARIASASPEVYWDIQAANPRGPLARQLFIKNVAELNVLMAGYDEDGFGASLDKVRDFLGSRRSQLDEMCIRIYSQMHTMAD